MKIGFEILANAILIELKYIAKKVVEDFKDVKGEQLRKEVERNIALYNLTKKGGKV